MKIDLKVFNSLAFLLLSWLIVGSGLYHVFQARLQEFLDIQQDISDQGLKITATEISSYIGHSRHLLAILVDNNLDTIRQLTNASNRSEASRKLESGIRDYFSESLGFVLSDAVGTVVAQSKELQPGKACRADIARFAQGQQLNEIHVHGNPDPDKFHIDILARVPDLERDADGILMVSLDTRVIQRLIANGQPYNHEFFLSSSTADKQHLIEMTGQGVWPHLTRSEFLSDSELHGAFASRAIDGTRWRIIDFVSTSYVSEVRDGYRDSALFIGVIYLLLSSLFFVIFSFNERRRIAQDIQIRQLNQSLENLLRRRTDQLEQSKQMLSYQASHDALTGLLNRREFESRLKDTIARIHEQPANRSALLYVDIDHIKVINETCGLVAGDEMLKQLSKALFGLLRRNDMLARIGGDEFGVLLEDCEQVQAGLVASTMREQIGQQGFIWDDRHFDLSASIGIAEINESIDDVSELLRQADAACYVAKERGRNQVHTYQPDDTMFQNRHSEMYWQGESMRLINKGAIELFAQKIHPLDAHVSAPWYEILVRLKDDNGNLVFPDRFIPALEQYGGIEKLDKEVVRGSMQYLAAHPGVRLNINLSGKSVGSSEMLLTITEFIQEYAVDPAGLVFEITETAAMVNVRQSRWFIEGIKALGCQMALDDFGSGMSSFSYLKNLDVDFVKLDGSFVRNLHQDPVHFEMVRSINGVTQVMGRSCIAEFVENEDVVAALRSIGVDYAQGYHIHKPEPLSAIQPNDIALTQNGMVDIPLS
jgi:diguanylate cyclase (GGDEF)-like protein